MYTSSKIAHLQKLAESRGQSLQVSASGNQYLVQYCADEKSLRTADSGLVSINSIQGHSFVDTPDRIDSSDDSVTAYDDPFSANIMMGGFTSSPIHSSDRSKQDALRNELSTAISGNTQQKRNFRERKDSAYLRNQKADSNSNVITLPAITLDSNQREQVKQLIEQGEDGKSIELTFGRINQADMKQICDDLQINSIDRILRFLA